MPVPGEKGSWVFAVAQRNGLAYIGLTDEPVSGPIPDVPEAPEADVEFLLRTLSGLLERPIGAEDVLGTFAGLRPLIEGDSLRSADLSRGHAIVRGDAGCLSVVGGKLTTYRRVAEDAVDAALAAAGLPARACRTRDLPLVGAASRRALAAVPAPARLVDRHGTEAAELMALAGGDPGLLAPLVPGRDVLRVEVLHAMRAEGALDAGDVLDRRTRIGLVAHEREQAAPLVEELIDLSSGRQAAAA
jgi:glycerol-3-phosphate dehydrogenase